MRRMKQIRMIAVSVVAGLGLVFLASRVIDHLYDGAPEVDLREQFYRGRLLATMHFAAAVFSALLSGAIAGWQDRRQALNHALCSGVLQMAVMVSIFLAHPIGLLSWYQAINCLAIVPAAYFGGQFSLLRMRD